MRTPFETLLETLSLDGTAETIGTVEDIGHHALILDVTPDELQRAALDVGPLAPDELQEALDEHADHAGADGVAHYILRTSGDGTLYFEGFATVEEARAAWSTVEARDEEARADVERELQLVWERENPRLWYVRHHAHTGCSAPALSFESEEEARAALAARLRALRADGYTLAELPPLARSRGAGAPYVRMLARFEATEPDTTTLQGDEQGTLELVGPDEEARADALETYLERWR